MALSKRSGPADGSTPPGTNGRLNFLRHLGPGLISGVSDDDPSGIATYSQAGAMLGYAACWIMLLCYPLMAITQEISARIGRATGTGIVGIIRRHYPPWVLKPVKETRSVPFTPPVADGWLRMFAEWLRS